MNHLDQITEQCTEAVKSINIDKRTELIDSILECRRTFIYGSGRSGLVGQLFAVRLVQMGFDAHFIGEMTTPIVTENDLTLLISNTGMTSSVVQTAEIAKRIGSKVISITGKPDSKLSKSSDVDIVLKIKDDVNTEKYAPLGTIFEDSAHLFFETVVYNIMEKKNITESDMRNRHAIWV